MAKNLAEGERYKIEGFLKAEVKTGEIAKLLKKNAGLQSTMKLKGELVADRL